MTFPAPSTVQLLASGLFAAAVLHTFSVSWFQRWACRFPSGSIAENLLHLLGEVEVVFGLWAAIFFSALVVAEGPSTAVAFLEKRDFTEPAFVFAVMTMAATRPVLNFAGLLIRAVARLLPFPPAQRYYVAVLTAGPILGSLITEPAAMTVTALLLKRALFDTRAPLQLKYATFALLFVSVSIGGTFTHFAAPPVLMVAGKWGWGIPEMFSLFGWKAAIAIAVSTLLVAWKFRREIRAHVNLGKDSPKEHSPAWVIACHLVFLGLLVASAHHMRVFLGIFLLFLGFTSVTREHQSALRLREALLVGLFLGGLVVLGAPQDWWLRPVLSGMSSFPLFAGATALTAITDNAALTYLGSLVPDLSESSKYALVAGAVTGGGLTVIANAPNPAGYGILNSSFGSSGIAAARLLLWALGPTLIAGACFWFL